MMRSTIQDAKVVSVIERLVESRRRPVGSGSMYNPHDFADYGFSIVPEQGDLIYLLCRAMGAMRDNGGGLVIGSELVPEKVATAKRNLSDAGLLEYTDIREGDARKTLSNLGGPIDFALIDGWPQESGPSLALQVIKIVGPHIRRGGYVLNDNAEPDFLDYIRDPANGFISLSLPIKRGTELCAKVA